MSSSSRSIFLYLTKTFYKNVESTLVIPMNNVSHISQAYNSQDLRVYTKGGESFLVPNKSLNDFQKQLQCIQEHVIKL